MHLATTTSSTIRLDDGADLAFRVDDYTLPWDSKPPVVMLHGLAESGETFRRWVPHLALHHVIVRPDLRGYGRSTAMAADYPYRFAQLGRDIIRLMDELQLDRAYLVGAKIGGTLAMHLAATYPARVLALAAVGAPASLTSFSERAPGWRAQIRDRGVEHWVRETTQGRLGTSLSPDALDWWVEMMSRTSPTTLEAFLQMVPSVDVTAQLPHVTCPAMVITTTGSGLGSVDAVRAWQETMPRSELTILPGDSYHVAATDPDTCAGIVRDFFDQQPIEPGSR